MLSQARAEELLLARLNSRFESARFSIAPDGVMERSFGWVFLIHVIESASGAVPEVKPPRAVIVNKYSEQIIASTIDHEPERLIQIYEILLAKNQARAGNWCLTGSLPSPLERWRSRSVERRARETGLYEIGGKGKEP
jgi:hypothetical protein